MTLGDLAVQSWCLRHFKENEKVAELVRECGLSRIELSGVHADFTDDKVFDKVIAIYRKAGISIVGIGVQALAGNALKEEKYFEFVKRAGARAMSVDFNLDTVPACYRTAEKLADKYDIRLGIHNHGGQHWLGSSTMLRHVFANTSSRVGLFLDTAWALASGEDPIAWVEAFRSRLYGLHIKDFVFDRAGRPQDVVVGTGNLDLGRLLSLLEQSRYDAPIVLEYEGDVEDPVPALKKCVAAVKNKLAQA